MGELFKNLPSSSLAPKLKRKNQPEAPVDRQSSLGAARSLKQRSSSLSTWILRARRSMAGISAKTVLAEQWAAVASFWAAARREILRTSLSRSEKSIQTPARIQHGLKNQTELLACFFYPRGISLACATAWRGGHQGWLCLLGKKFYSLDTNDKPAQQR